MIRWRNCSPNGTSVMLRVNPDPSFEQDVDRLKEMGYQIDDLKYVIGLLAKEKMLNPKYKDHSLRSKYAGMRECHIEDDWLLIYQVEKSILRLIATGTHEDLFTA